MKTYIAGIRQIFGSVKGFFRVIIPSGIVAYFAAAYGGIMMDGHWLGYGAGFVTAVVSTMLWYELAVWHTRHPAANAAPAYDAD